MSIKYISKWLSGTKYCRRCGCKVKLEFILDYPYYCPDCDENMYSFEVTDEKPIHRNVV